MSSRGIRGRVGAAAALCALCLMWASAAAAQDIVRFKDPADRFLLEFPRSWNWQIVAGAVEPIVTLIGPGGTAYVIIEHIHLNVPLAAEQVTDAFAEVEADVLKDNQPRATDLDAKMMTQSGRRFVMLRYRRPGLIGDSERVIQYSYPLGRDLFRITCAAVSAQFAKNEPIFAAVAESFSPTTRSTR